MSCERELKLYVYVVIRRKTNKILVTKFYRDYSTLTTLCKMYLKNLIFLIYNIA